MSAIAAVAGVARSDTLEALLGAVRSFTAREVDPRAASWDAAEALAPGLAAQAAELGLLGVSAPEADGGLGAGLFGAAWVIEAVAASSGTLAVLLALHEAAAVGLALALPGAQARGAAMAAATTGLSQLSGWIGPQHGLVHAQVGDALALRGRVGMAVAASAPLVLASRGAQGDALHRAVPGAAAQPRAAHGLRAGLGGGSLELDLRWRPRPRGWSATRPPRPSCASRPAWPRSSPPWAVASPVPPSARRRPTPSSASSSAPRSRASRRFSGSSPTA
ncbi:MAG: acyl-CoA dehydrogenase family protein [Deltaproteobacteria bacterium]|nr:acyl-CoA dehydrogenase family protein [Deltaproteobacteria bacterium]